MVAIKDMKMPSHCGECPFALKGQSQCLFFPTTVWEYNIGYCIDDKYMPEWRPLIEVRLEKIVVSAVDNENKN